MVTLDIIKDENRFFSLKDEWNSLLKKTGIENPFLRHEWLAAWWKCFGTGKEMLVLCLKDRGEAIGLVPLMRYRTRLTGLPVKTVGFIANHWTRMDFMIQKERDICMSEIANFLMKTGNVMIFAHMDAGGKDAPAIKKIMSGAKKKVACKEKLDAYVPLQGTWNDYLSRRTKHFRKEYNRKLRLLRQKGEISFIKDGECAEKTITQMLRIAKKSWQYRDNVNVFASERGQKFYEHLIQHSGDKQFIELSVLKAAGEPVSYIVGVKSEKTYFVFETAYDEEYRDYSPGMVIHNLLLEGLFGTEFEYFDFGYIEDFKRRWADKVRPVEDITVFPEGLIGTNLFLANRMKERIKRR